MSLAPSTFLILTALAVAYLTVLTLIGVHARHHNTARAWRSEWDRFTFGLSLVGTLVLFGFSASHTARLLPDTISGIFGTAMTIGTWAMAAWIVLALPYSHLAAAPKEERS